MPTAVLKAHFNGERIVLDEPFDLPANATLFVTVMAPDAERSAWMAKSSKGLDRAYGDDEPEYSERDLKRP